MCNSLNPDKRVAPSASSLMCKLKNNNDNSNDDDSNDNNNDYNNV